MLPSYAYIVSTLGVSSIGTSFAHMLCFGINIVQGNYFFFFPLHKTKTEKRQIFIHTHPFTQCLEDSFGEKLKLKTSDLSDLEWEFDPTCF